MIGNMNPIVLAKIIEMRAGSAEPAADIICDGSPSIYASENLYSSLLRSVQSDQEFDDVSDVVTEKYNAPVASSSEVVTPTYAESTLERSDGEPIQQGGADSPSVFLDLMKFLRSLHVAAIFASPKGMVVESSWLQSWTPGT